MVSPRTLVRALIERLDPVPWAERVSGATLDDWQADVLRGGHERVILNVHRQGGKSTVAALLGLHVATTEPGALVLLLSPTQRQSGELLHTVAGLYGADESAIETDAQSALKLELANGSRILSLPGQERTVRGYSGVRLLIVDEGSRVPDALWHVVTPMLAVSGGSTIVMSTPWGRRGFFWREWDQGQDWQRVKFKAEQCPRITSEFLARERASMPGWVYRQEYECEFLDPEDAVFSHERIMAALSDDVAPLFPEDGIAGASEARVPVSAGVAPLFAH